MHAFEELQATANMLSCPDAAFDRFLAVATAVLANRTADDDDLLDVLADCARWVSLEIRHAL